MTTDVPDGETWESWSERDVQLWVYELRHGTRARRQTTPSAGRTDSTKRVDHGVVSHVGVNLEDKR